MHSARSLLTWPRRLAALAACAAAPAWAVCTPETFPTGDIAARVAAMRQTCEGPRTRWRLVTPSRLVMQPRFDGQLTRAVGPGIESGLRVTWSGQGNGGHGELRTDKALIASAWRWQPADVLTMNLRLGRERLGVMRNRIAMEGVWMPTRQALMFAEWAGSRTGIDERLVGLRWWLPGQRFALEAGARHLAGGAGWTGERIGLTVRLGR